MDGIVRTVAVVNPPRDVCNGLCLTQGSDRLDADIDRYAILDLLTTLVDQSLVTTDERGPEIRYRLLETVRNTAPHGSSTPANSATYASAT